MKILQVIILLALVLTLAQKGSCQSPSNSIKTISGRTIDASELTRIVEKAMDSLKIPGISMAIINDANLVYHQSFGVKNIETKEPVDQETIFEGASLSKPLFAYFFMKMVDKGIVSLDAPIYNLLPLPPGSIKDNDDRHQLITPRMVLCHSTGFPNWSKNKPIEISFTPGTGFSYSGEAHQHLTAYLAVANSGVTNYQKESQSRFLLSIYSMLGATFFCLPNSNALQFCRSSSKFSSKSYLGFRFASYFYNSESIDETQQHPKNNIKNI